MDSLSELIHGQQVLLPPAVQNLEQYLVLNRPDFESGRRPTLSLRLIRRYDLF